MRCRSRLDFVGALDPTAFVDFMEHRARRLDLTTQVEIAGPQRVRVTVEGEPDLIDAFEMACSLGPIDCRIREVLREVLRASPAEDAS